MVSVILPAFNAEVFLRQAVESVLKQTFRDFELIVINDGSTDGTASVLQDYAKDRRLTVVNQENSGLVTTLNRGLEMASGALIARMDADDICLPERFARQVQAFERSPDLAVLGTYINLVDTNGNFLRLGDYPTSRNAVTEFIERGSPLAHPTVMMRKDPIIAVGGYREQYRHAEDYDLWLRLVDAGYAIENLPEALLYYRQHSSNVSSQHRYQQELATMVAQMAHLVRKSGAVDPTDNLSQIDESTFSIFPKAYSTAMTKRAFLLKHRELSGYSLGDLVDALAAFRALPKTIRSDRGMVDFHLRCAVASLRSRRYLKALTCVARTLQLDPRYVAGRVARKTTAWCKSRGAPKP